MTDNTEWFINICFTSILFSLDVISVKTESAKSEPNLESVLQKPVNFEEDSQENKENFVPPDQFNDHNIK